MPALSQLRICRHPPPSPPGGGGEKVLTDGNFTKQIFWVQSHKDDFHKKNEDSIVLRVANKEVDGSNWSLVDITEFYMQYYKHTCDINANACEGKEYEHINPFGGFEEWPQGVSERNKILNIDTNITITREIYQILVKKTEVNISAFLKISTRPHMY